MATATAVPRPSARSGSTRATRTLSPARRVAAALAATALACVGVVAADVPAVSTAHSAGTSVVSTAVTGTVERVADGVLVLRTASGDLQRLVVAGGSRLLRDGREVLLDELGVGDRVTAR